MGFNRIIVILLWKSNILTTTTDETCCGGFPDKSHPPNPVELGRGHLEHTSARKRKIGLGRLVGRSRLKDRLLANKTGPGIVKVAGGRFLFFISSTKSALLAIYSKRVDRLSICHILNDGLDWTGGHLTTAMDEELSPAQESTWSSTWTQLNLPRPILKTEFV